MQLLDALRTFFARSSHILPTDLQDGMDRDPTFFAQGTSLSDYAEFVFDVDADVEAGLIVRLHRDVLCDGECGGTRAL